MKNLIKIVLLSLLLLGATVFLVSRFGLQKIMWLNADGTVTVVEYRNPLPLIKAPSFENENGTIHAYYRKELLYRLEIIPEEEIEAEFAEREPVAESANIKVYRSEDGKAEFPYTYVMSLVGTETAFIRFRSAQAPDSRGRGNDFGNRVRYTVEGVHTYPDLDGLK